MKFAENNNKKLRPEPINDLIGDRITILFLEYLKTSDFDKNKHCFNLFLLWQKNEK